MKFVPSLCHFYQLQHFAHGFRMWYESWRYFGTTTFQYLKLQYHGISTVLLVISVKEVEQAIYLQYVPIAYLSCNEKLYSTSCFWWPSSLLDHFCNFRDGYASSHLIDTKGKIITFVWCWLLSHISPFFKVHIFPFSGVHTYLLPKKINVASHFRTKPQFRLI